MFSDRRGEGFSSVLQYANKERSMELEVVAGFNQILTKLSWTAFWASDHTQAFCQWVPHTLPRAPGGIKIENRGTDFT